MITEDLFNEILVKPVYEGASGLLVISGYANANMAYRHLDEDVIKEKAVRVSLIYGMAAKDGVSLADHEGFKRLEGNGLFQCHYRLALPAVHSKVYIWLDSGRPIKAFVGSADYTQQGFGLARNQGEAMAEVSPQSAFDYFELTLQGSMEAKHDDIKNHVRFYNGGQHRNGDNDCRTVSLLGVDREVQRSAGLNWGHRQQAGYNRNRNEAYIQIGAQLGREDFFPARPTRFTIHADDGASFVVVRAQKSDPGDAIETPEDNSLLGAYFRNRIGVQPGEFVTRAMLERYGRTNVEFCKIDDDEFLMDFSV